MNKRPHSKIKPTKFIKSRDSLKGLSNNENPTESKAIATDYITNKKLADEMGLDSILTFEDGIIYSFDCIRGKKKIIIPEINPTIIFFSNATMSIRSTLHYREELFKNSPSTSNFNININPNDFANFFQPAVNCIINMQAALESFANRVIPKEYEPYDITGNKINQNLFFKLDTAVPEISKKVGFELERYKKHRKRIREIIELRNDIIHLTPAFDTNTAYKDVYRRLLKNDFENSLIAVRTYINFYEENLIEDCECNKEFFYAVQSIE